MQIPDSLHQLMTKDGYLDNHAIDLILEHVKPTRNPVSGLLIVQDTSAMDEYFLLAGHARTYVLSPEGDERTLELFSGPCVITPQIARTEADISLLNIEISADAIIWQLQAAKLLELMVAHSPIRSWGNRIMQQTLIEKTEKEICLASRTTRERLDWLRQKQPSAENTFAHTHIASFLGMTPVSLSRLRHQ